MDENDRYDACIDGAAAAAPAKAIVPQLKVEPPPGTGGGGCFHLFSLRAMFLVLLDNTPPLSLSSFTEPRREFDKRNMWKKVKGEGQIMPQRAGSMREGKGRMEGIELLLG